MNTRDITTFTDDELQAESDALTRECLAAWRRKREADLAWGEACDRKADATLERARRAAHVATTA